jgi:hypothetical protein
MTTNAIGTGDERLPATAVAIPQWLSLAAAPTFAIMALVTGVHGGGPHDVLCAAAQDASPLDGMVGMYLLMSVFHSAPWLKLIVGRPDSAHFHQILDGRTTQADTAQAHMCS